ncbi:dipeptidyl aminopeptidase/acylaminoacyl peptidase [Hymenobacter luteus]|uniref:Dipeptidyl aminopeptidase/acylaminoacyl peptidase n=2 Tax=Hymenobacter TaxID=89966 RepID=A0A7W9T4H1_9BACT|nr:MULTISPECIES: prolyl oligopeptidase family serine peptidase [Hymenobacter]MBB4602682.1 dipeptidyl aminopeptidase/acylaminoacyl peptidase [Hymenobacter latericoloratus]MBB6060573.1 dipeptidyl aminopeptidase/acylaminoacyl peptidase [Hymenobacter luteus]
MKILRLTLALCVGTMGLAAAQDLPYQTPPRAIAALAEAPPTPRVSFASNGQWMLVMEVRDMPTIAELSQPELRLAGLRINPRTNGSSRASYASSMRLRQLPDGKELLITGLPANARISDVQWSPDNTKIAFTHTTNNHVELWIADVASASARLVPNLFLNSVFGTPFEWVSDNKTIIARAVVGGRGEAPSAAEAPKGPAIQQNIGKTAGARTYQDLLKNPIDERLFDYYALAQVVKVGLDGRMAPLGQPGIIQQALPAPNGRYVMVRTRHRPYSYTLPVSSFPQRVDILNLEGLVVKELAEVPLADNVPTSFDAVPTGPRQFGWREDAPNTAFWVEAQDGGNPKTEAAVRDKLYGLAAPFDGQPQELAALPLRFRDIHWGNDKLALVEGYRWADRKETTWTLDLATKTSLTPLFERSAQDTYTHPGSPYLRRNAQGRYVLATDVTGDVVYLIGAGASPEGERPFIDELNVRTKKSLRWWRSEAPYYEMPVSILDANKRMFVTRRESPQESPNYFLRDAPSLKLTPLTKFPNPYATLGNLQKQVLKYKRADGVELTANLYLPPNYKKEDGPLPTLMEAYPVEFKDKKDASQVKGSPYTFARLNWGSPVFWVTQGYAVLQGTSIPIVGEGTKQPNDTYVEQLTASAKAAIDEGKRLGVVDPNRVAVMGHSYGAFMTANLLAHTNLFKAGIARSGAYNRTLTPFGFQGEERTFWEAPEVYNAMSPFNFANKIKTPILLIHGEADNNSGTFPIQSERFYNALKGHGATVRYVVLPAESHGYAARESIMHMLWEMNTWLDTYVKKASPGEPLK